MILFRSEQASFKFNLNLAPLQILWIRLGPHRRWTFFFWIYCCLVSRQLLQIPLRHSFFVRIWVYSSHINCSLVKLFRVLLKRYFPPARLNFDLLDARLLLLLLLKSLHLLRYAIGPELL